MTVRVHRAVQNDDAYGATVSCVRRAWTAQIRSRRGMPRVPLV